VVPRILPKIRPLPRLLFFLRSVAQLFEIEILALSDKSNLRLRQNLAIVGSSVFRTTISQLWQYVRRWSWRNVILHIEQVERHSVMHECAQVVGWFLATQSIVRWQTQGSKAS
jgi:hypothetical protein